jgi:hypothetical protein
MRLSVQSNRVHVQSSGSMEELKNIETTWENCELYYISAPKEILKYEFLISNYGSSGHSCGERNMWRALLLLPSTQIWVLKGLSSEN